MIGWEFDLLSGFLVSSCWIFCVFQRMLDQKFLTNTSTSIRLPHLSQRYHDHWIVTINDGKGWKGWWCARGLIDVRTCIRGLGVGIKFFCCTVVNPSFLTEA